jgi:hypothetical protein
MGRTLATSTQLVDQEIEAWSKFRRALRKEDQEAFDDLLTYARFHAAAAAYASRVVPFETMLMTMLIEQQKVIHSLNRRIGKLEETLSQSAAVL